MDTQEKKGGQNIQRIEICLIMEYAHVDRLHPKQQGPPWGALVPLALVRT